MWVLVTTAWRFLRLRIEERHPIWREGANTLNKQSRTADKGWFSNLAVGRGVENSSLWKQILLRVMNTCLGRGLILWYDLSNESGKRDLLRRMLEASIRQVHLQQKPGN